MRNQRYTPEFKDEAARQIVDRGYSVADVSKRLGVSAHSLYKWVKAIKPDKSEEPAAALIEAKSEVLRLRAQLRRANEPGVTDVLVAEELGISARQLRRWRDAVNRDEGPANDPKRKIVKSSNVILCLTG